jgi:hypothetical protein
MPLLTPRRSSSRFARPLFAAVTAIGLAGAASATNHILRQDEVMAGLNGDPKVQFIEITVGGDDQKNWGPQGAETTSRAMLVFFNGNGVQTGTFFFPSNPPAGLNTVLIATTNFAALAGAPIPDMIMPPLLNPGSGKVCFKGNPGNFFAFDVNLCLSYGNFPANQTDGAGAPAPALPMVGEPNSLTRVQNFVFGSLSSRNADFILASPTPANTRGQTMIFPVDGPEIDFLPSSLNLGDRDMTLGPSTPQTVIITNRGTVNPLVITNISVAGTDANQFTIANDSGQTTLPPGGLRTVQVTFDPNSPGTKSASLLVVCNDTNETLANVELRGFGVDPNAPEIDLLPAVVNFPNQNIASGSTPLQNVTITNRGSLTSLVVSNFVIGGTHAGQFRITSSTNLATVVPRGSRIVNVAFDPDSAGPKNALLRIFSTDPDEGVAEVQLRGNGFDLNPCVPPNPTNTFAQNIAGNAQMACPGFTFSGTTLGATPDGASTCAGGFPDVWYRYIPGSNGTLVARLVRIGLASPMILSAHAAAPGSVQNQFGCVNVPSNSPNASLTLPVTNGAAVLIRIAGLASSSTSFELTLEGPPCSAFDRNENGITDSCEFDFGDAPAPYPTTLANDGARHRAFTPLFLGQRVDPNADGGPTALATGDNQDGPPNDEDGVTLLSPIGSGSVVSTADLRVVASAAGALNAWIDFNADGDWADPGEQIFSNRALLAGANLLSFAVPSGATPTNRTFARFRISSAGSVSFTGSANDGEVEDYAMEILPELRTAGELAVRINEVMAGLNGDSTVQFVELQANGTVNKAWGPQGGEGVGRAMLVFFDEAGRQTGRFVFPSNAPSGADTVLVATPAFADHTGLEPDFVISPEVLAIAGKVAFQSNPDNRHFDINVALSYGGPEYFGPTDGAGPANTNQLPILHARSLGRVQEFPFGLNDNAAFQLGIPTPRNTAGETFALTSVSLPEQGNTLFSRETFRGNGRTCATCHLPGKDQFGLTPMTILNLPPSDPLFVFEENVNLLKLAVTAQPSDLRGEINGTMGSAKVLAGSGDTYLVIGGTNLAGAITDQNGNGGMLQSITEGDLDGPTPGNGSPRGLEHHALLEHGRGLILENIDGFKRGEVFRASPHLLNLALTAPFGLSGEFDSLEDFSDGAVVQHFPRSLARVSGVDFRHPTREELEAMTAFMFGISNPPTNSLNLDRFATTEAQKRGRAMFFGDEGRCSKCHNGPVLALSDGTLPGSVTNRNDNFNTGVANVLRNLMDGLPTEPAGRTPGQSDRKFNTPPLFNIRLTAPFFHDGSAATLTDAVKFYDAEEFHSSPAGADVGSLLAANKPDKVADMVAFLESLVELPVSFTRELAFGVNPPFGPLTVGITNSSSTTLAITNLVINGTNATDFEIVSDAGEINLAPGETHLIQVAYGPATAGAKQATLEIYAHDTNLLGSFSFGVALNGADSIVQASPSSEDFGAHVTLRWTAVAGRRYQVQFKANLSDAEWTNLPGEVTATGNSAFLIDTPAPATQRFYRVMALP